MTELCRGRQAELRAEARLRGERLLAERADDLKERVVLYWGAACRLAALHPSKDAPANGHGQDHKDRQGPRGERAPGKASGRPRAKPPLASPAA